MKKFQTAKLIYDRERGVLYPVRGVNILAESLEEAEYYVYKYRPDLVITEEIEQYREVLRVGNNYYEFNYN